MARLTRTQKYAELRDSLANDKEASLKTKDLSSYEDRLNNITDQLSPLNQEPVVETPVVNAPVEEDPKYTWQEFKDLTPIEELVESFKNEELEQQIQQISQESSVHEALNESWIKKEIEKAPVEEPVEEVNIASTAQLDTIEEAPAFETLHEEVTNVENPEQPVTEVEATPVEVTPVETVTVEEAPAQTAEVPYVETTPVVTEEVQAQPEETQPVEVETQNTNESYLGLYNPTPEVEELYKEVEQQTEEENVTAEPITAEEIVVDVPAVEETEVAPVEESAPVQESVEVQQPVEASNGNDIAEFADNHAVEHYDEPVNSYMSDTINEVGEYNKLKGDMTISQLANNMVNEIRHPGETDKKVEAPVVKEATTVDDEEFSNTVSMEIAKIMDEIKAPEIKEEEPVAEVPEVLEAPEETIVVEEHPVLAKSLEEPEDVVEIKNINELDAQPMRDTVSNTIPFVVATGDDEEEIEEDDEEGSNTILNIILIVLIIVLIAVLGLIVFYILKTKGVI